VLLALGMAVLAAGFAREKDAIVVAGLATAILGVLLERLAGEVQIGVQGLRGSLISRDDLIRQVRERSEAEGLEPTKRDKAVAEVEEFLPPDAAIVVQAADDLEVRRRAIINVLTGNAIKAANREECGECGLPLPAGFDEPERRPCPRCGSTTRAFIRAVGDSLSRSD
jgi:ribosomal protein S27AE